MMANGTNLASPQERIQARLAEPGTAEALERLLDRIEVVAFGVEALDGFIRRSEQLVDSLAASIRDLKSAAGEGQSVGSDFVSALPQLARVGSQVAAATEGPGFRNLMESGLLEKLGNPQTIATIEILLGKLELAAFGLAAIEGFLKRGEEIADSVGDNLSEVRKLVSTMGAGIDLEKLKILPRLYDTLPALLDSGILDQLPAVAKIARQLLDSALLRPEVIASLAALAPKLADSFNEARRSPPRTISVFGLLMALRDPDINRSLVVLLETGKRFGKKLK